MNRNYTPIIWFRWIPYQILHHCLIFTKQILFLVCCCSFSQATFAVYETNISQGVPWLVSQQNSDGSWGSNDRLKFLYTVEAVDALRAVGQRIPPYFKGITWIENHSAGNADYLARRALTLLAHGDDVSHNIAELESAQMIGTSGRDAWGASSEYLESNIDTAIVLKTLSSSATLANLQAAIDVLKSTQLTSASVKGWPVSLDDTSDPFTTAQVVKTFSMLTAIDPTLTTNIADGLSALSSLVTAASPIYLQAQTAQAAELAGNTGVSLPLLMNLQTDQNTNGSWNDNIYETALSLRAFAIADGLDTPANYINVLIPDPNLRRAINLALGRSSMDAVNRNDLLNLTDIVATDLDINDLTGLELAINLMSADFTNNNITDASPVQGLPNLASLILTGNPADPGFTVVPMMPVWGIVFMVLVIAFYTNSNRILGLRRSYENT